MSFEQEQTTNTGCRIQVLSDDLANQIAAGEVVQRPASALKELCENSLDAGATSIEVEIDGGGISRLVILDDGGGMTRDEAVLALARHATSKLRTADDLFSIATMGFRGEALPSIASVSRFSLTTRRPGDVAGTLVELEGGGKPRVRDAGCAVGTRVEVRDLFFNVPARRKFLKAEATERGNAVEVVSRLALARPDVSFRVRADGREVFHAPKANTPKTRAAQVLGRKVAEELYPFREESPSLSIEGLLGHPGLARTGTKGISLFVNRRYVVERSISQALAAAYGGMLEKGKYPLAILWIEIDPSKIDVNVHPAKEEIRFSDPQRIFSAVRRSAIEGLRNTPWLGSEFYALQRSESSIDLGSFPEVRETASTATVQSLPTTPARLMPTAASLLAPLVPLAPLLRGAEDPALLPREAPLREEARPIEQGMLSWSNRVPSLSSAMPTSFAAMLPPSLQSAPQVSAMGEVAVSFEEESKSLDLLANAMSRPTEEEASLPLPEPPAPTGALFAGGFAPRPYPLQDSLPTRGFFQSLRLVGQVKKTYLLFEADKGFFMVDQHAGHERVMYERLKSTFEKHDVVSQKLLFPATVSLSATEVAACELHEKELTALGLEVAPFGPQTVAIVSVPQLFSKTNPEQLLKSALDDLSNKEQISLEERFNRTMATMACHGSVRAGQTLTHEEIKALLSSMDVTPNCGHCPHGRPVYLELSWRELEKRFGRLG